MQKREQYDLSHNLKIHNIRNVNFHDKQKHIGQYFLITILIVIAIGVCFKLTKNNSTLKK